MCTVISEIKINNYMVLKLDKDIPMKKYSKYLIGKKEYAIVPIYDADRCIAIEAAGSFIGEKVDFI